MRPVTRPRTHSVAKRVLAVAGGHSAGRGLASVKPTVGRLASVAADVFLGPAVILDG